jgi:hypothetical protein
MVNLSKLSKDELRATGFKNVSVAKNYIKDILKTKAQKYNKEELINKLTSEFNKFKNFGIDLNEANKTSKKAELTSKKAEISVKKGEQDLYDLTKGERDKIRNEIKSKLVNERKQKKAGKKIVKFARKKFAKEIIKDENYDEVYFDSNKEIQADYKGFLEPAVKQFINKYYKLPTHVNFKNGEKYKNSYYFTWSGLEAFKKDMEHIYINEKNAFKCNISMAYILYAPYNEYYRNEKNELKLKQVGLSLIHI